MYTYAFLSNLDQSLELPAGMVGDLEIVNRNQLAALVEPTLTVEELQDNDQRLVRAVLDHDRIIRELFEQTTVLPLRFGTSFVSLSALFDHLLRHETAYLEKLLSLTGRAEYPLKLVPIPLPEMGASNRFIPDQPQLDRAQPDRAQLDLPPLKGKDYFQAKKRQYQSQIEWLEEQQRELQRLVAAIGENYPELLRGEANEDVERIYLLGDRHQEDVLHQRFQSWQDQSLRWQLTLGERLPPYHFV